MSRSSSNNYRVLIADDNPEQREMLAHFLSDVPNVVFDYVTNGEEVIEAYSHALREGSPYSMLVLDVVMPLMSGLRAAEIIRNGFSDKQTPIRFLTADINLTNLTQTRASMADGEVWIKGDAEHSPHLTGNTDAWDKLDATDLRERIVEELLKQ